MKRLINKALKVEGVELSYLLWLLLLGFFLGIATAVFNLIASVNFLEGYDSSYLPGAIICAGLAGVFVTNTYISVQNWVSFSKVSLITLLILVFSVFGVYLAFGLSYSPAVDYIAFVIIGPVTALSFQVFRGLFEQMFDIAQVKRLSVIAQLGMVLAQVSVLSLIAVQVYPVFFSNPVTLYLIATLAFVASLLVLSIICSKYEHLRKILVNVQYIKAYNNYKKLIRQPYIVHLALFSLFSGIVFYLVDFAFLNFIDTKYADNSGMLGFLAAFYASVFGVAFLIEALILQWVSDKYGLLVTLMIAPVLVSLFTAIYGIIGTLKGYNPEESIYFLILMLVCISKAFSFTLFKSLEIPSFKLFFMPLDQMLRADIQGKTETVIREAGKVLAGLITVVFLYYLDTEYYPYLIIGVIVIWGYITFKINGDYKLKLKQSLDKQDQGSVERKDKPVTGIISELETISQQGNAEQVKVYLSVLKILDPITYKQCLLEMLYSNNDEVQKVALNEASMLCLLPAIPVLENIQESRFYPILKNRDLIDRVCVQLKGADFRLKKIKYVEQLTVSKIRRERIFGALLAAYMDPEYKPKLLNKLFRDTDEKVRYMAVASAANSENNDLHKNLIEKLGESEYGNAAVSSITCTGEKMLTSLVNAFYLTGQEEKIQLRIVQALGRIGSEEAIQLLVKKLSYKNQNVSKAAFEAISTSGFNIKGNKVLTFKAELEEYVNVLVWNMSVLLDLMEYEASQTLINAVKAEIDSNYNVIFKILSLLYDPKTIALIQKNIFSEDAESSEYAYELLDVVLTEEIKPFLLPVLNTWPYEERVEKMQGQFPTEPLEKLEILYDLVQRDYKYVNRWTKACALKELAEENEEIDFDIFLANIINPDPLLKETAAVALYIKAPELFYKAFERFKRELDPRFGKELEGKIQINRNSDAFSVPSLQFEIIKYLNEVDHFREVPGIILMEVARVSEFKAYSEGDVLFKSVETDSLDYFIVRTGEVTVYRDGIPEKVYSPKSLIHNFEFISEYSCEIEIKAGADCEVYKIRKEKLNELMSFHEEIAWSIVNYTKKGKKERVERQLETV